MSTATMDGDTPSTAQGRAWPRAEPKAETLADRLEPQPGYNFAHFRTGHLLADALRTLRGTGVRPGDPAADFDLPVAGGGRVRLADLLGTPVLLHFGSIT